MTKNKYHLYFNKFIIIFLFLCLTSVVICQETRTISGYLKDSQTLIPIIGATITSDVNKKVNHVV